MIWEVEIVSREEPGELRQAIAEFDLLTHSQQGREVFARYSHGYLLEGDLSPAQVQTLTRELLVDPVVEEDHIAEVNENRNVAGQTALTVLLKPGVMDPVSQSVLAAAQDLGMSLNAVRTLRRYYLHPQADATRPELSRILANDAIEQLIRGPVHAEHLGLGRPYEFRLLTVPIRELDDSALLELSHDGQLALNLAEMKTIQAHFRHLNREPTDVELETLAQTWSEHCSHKTLKGPIDFTDASGHVHHFKNLLKETIFAATQELRKQFGKDDWCVSVFADNAGVVKFDDQYHVCFKVETHNHPSAIEPYGGANTGLGGVIRDVLGTGLGAKPICNTDVFCFAPPDLPPESLPAGVLHPRKVMTGVVSGVRDYGNRIGIPTVNGAVHFDERYLGNPLVFCGTVGLIPVDRCHKEPQDGDLIVVVGGRTGRDGIHGATFSSLELTQESEAVSGGAVQIGNAITEKKMLDVLLQARDRGLYTAITDCGAGGFSSAIGEMGAELGATVNLEKAPLKYEGLSYAEIWISEAQERMVLAVSPNKWPALKALCDGEDVEAAILGKFEATGKLRLFYQKHLVGELDMKFLHDGRPEIVRKAQISPSPPASGGEGRGEGGGWPASATSLAPSPPSPLPRSGGEGGKGSALTDWNTTLQRILSSYSVCSKEKIIRQYDHEVQGGSVVKPLVGLREDGPGDAAVVAPVLGSFTGLAIGCGINPHYGDLDPYWMAAAAIDEAVRNVVAVGADPARIAILDNFCWGNTERPEVLGSLVRAAQACHDIALAYGTPFISGKDSLNNEFRTAGRLIVIPPTLLISALGRVNDVRQCVTIDLKEPGNDVYLIGTTKNEMGGSHFNLVHGISGGEVPKVNRLQAPNIFRALHAAISAGCVLSCHDLSEGGLAVAAAEMAFAGGVGADLTDAGGIEADSDEVRLFSESSTRFLVEVRPEMAGAFARHFENLPLLKIGRTVREPRLRIAGANGEWLIWAQLEELKEAWQRPLRA
ncbi:MAG TPA: AIR synthase-related protein [Gemmataceae bacterium]|jgi:phosphoribosylformylglycinamidine synthase|nr:AIR synthase-related protein [Gemmataceae bacterium]